jgi:hypothetical protein
MFNPTLPRLRERPRQQELAMFPGKGQLSRLNEGCASFPEVPKKSYKFLSRLHGPS